MESDINMQVPHGEDAVTPTSKNHGKTHKMKLSDDSTVDVANASHAGDNGETKTPTKRLTTEYRDARKRDIMLERVSALTMVSGLGPGSLASRDYERQLLLNTSESPSLMKKPKKSPKDKLKTDVVKPTSASGSRSKVPEESLVPFWLTSPKDVKDISSYMKTICTRLSQIEKQMKRFETERQGLLNALYQVNLKQLNEQSSQSINHSDQIEEETKGDQGTQSLPDSKVITVDSDGKSSIVTDTKVDAVDATDSINVISKSQDVSASVNDETLDACMSNEEEEIKDFEMHSLPSEQATSYHEEHDRVTEENKDVDKAIEVIDIDDSDGTFKGSDETDSGPVTRTHVPSSNDMLVETSIEECSENMLRNICKLSNMLDMELEFNAGSQVERNAVDYNAGVFTESKNTYEFKMWRSCWLKPAEKGLTASTAIAPKRSAAASRGFRQTVEQTAHTEGSNGKATEERPKDMLEYFWEMDFQTLSKQQLTMLAQFFGMKANLNTKCQIEQMERIRSYLTDYRIK